MTEAHKEMVITEITKAQKTLKRWQIFESCFIFVCILIFSILISHLTNINNSFSNYLLYCTCGVILWTFYWKLVSLDKLLDRIRKHQILRN
jgi:hypothetical protein